MFPCVLPLHNTVVKGEMCGMEAGEMASGADGALVPLEARWQSSMSQWTSVGYSFFCLKGSRSVVNCAGQLLSKASSEEITGCR